MKRKNSIWKRKLTAIVLTIIFHLILLGILFLNPDDPQGIEGLIGNLASLF